MFPFSDHEGASSVGVSLQAFRILFQSLAAHEEELQRVFLATEQLRRDREQVPLSLRSVQLQF